MFGEREPKAHGGEAPTRTAAPRGSTRLEPPRCAGPTSSASPPNPIRSPITTLGTGLTPPGRSQSTMTSHSDTVATRSAAMPEGTVLFRPTDPAIAHKQQQSPGNDRCYPVSARRPDPGLPSQDWVKKNTHKRVAEPSQDERGKRFDPNSDHQLRRAPNNVDVGGGHKHQ